MIKTFLHVGCGPQNKSSCFGFNNDNWKEIRLDDNKNANPDIVGSLTDMKSVETDSFDAVYSSHDIVKLFPHEVPIALKEFYRVLREDGIVVITCSDLQSVGQAILQDKLLERLYSSPAGPVTAFDILYGHRNITADGNTNMIHKSGFTYSLLNKGFYDAGFKARYGGRRPQGCDLFLVAFKNKIPEEEIKKIGNPFIPS